MQGGARGTLIVSQVSPGRKNHLHVEIACADAYAAIAGAAPEGLPTFADGARSARVVDAVLASAAADAWVEL